MKNIVTALEHNSRVSKVELYRDGVGCWSQLQSLTSAEAMPARPERLNCQLSFLRRTSTYKAVPQILRDYIRDIGSSTHTRSFTLCIFPANENNRLRKTLNHFLGGNLGPLRMFALLLIHPSTFHFTFERLEIHP